VEEPMGKTSLYVAGLALAAASSVGLAQSSTLRAHADIRGDGI